MAFEDGGEGTVGGLLGAQSFGGDLYELKAWGGDGFQHGVIVHPVWRKSGLAVLDAHLVDDEAVAKMGHST